MITALMFAAALFAQIRQDLWIATEANEREVVAVNVGWAFVPEGKDYLLVSVYTEHRQGTAATGWTTPAQTSEQLAVRCTDQTFLVRGSSTSSSVADPIRVSEPDGAFVSLTTDPRRQKQADAVCRPETNDTPGFRTLSALLQAHGVRTGAPAALPRLAGPRPYTAAPGERDRVAREPERPYPPRIGVNASQAHNPGGGLVIGYAGYRLGGRWVSEFYSMGAWASNPAAEPILFVRRALDSWEAQEQIRWADSRTCPGLVAALRPANDLALPLLILPLDEASRTRRLEAGYTPPPSPNSYEFWSPASGPLGNSLQFAANGGPWTDWAQSVDRVLEPCWQENRPINPPDDDGS